MCVQGERRSKEQGGSRAPRSGESRAEAAQCTPLLNSISLRPGADSRLVFILVSANSCESY